MKNNLLECGKIVTCHGIAGEVKIQPWSNSPEDLLNVTRLYFDQNGTFLEVRKLRVHKNMLIAKLSGVESVEAAQQLRGKVVMAERSELTLEEGEYFIADLLGLEVLDVDTGARYGKLCDVTETGANDVYHIQFEDGTVRLIPVIPQVVIETDIEGGFIKIRPLKGLFDDED